MTDAASAHDKRDKRVDVTVRTPAGHSAPFTFKANERADKVVRVAVDHFVTQGQLAAGDYSLAVVRDGDAVDLADAGRLDDYAIVDGDVLVLISKAPQVDG
jgi:hypothetical protein